MTYPNYPSPQNHSSEPATKRTVWPWFFAGLAVVLAIVVALVVGINLGASETTESTAPEKDVTATEEEAMPKSEDIDIIAQQEQNGLNTVQEQPPSNKSKKELDGDFKDPDQVERTERGSILMKPGETAVSYIPGKGEIANLTVNSIQVDPVCNGEYVREPQNGHFLVLDVSIELASLDVFKKAGPFQDYVSLRQGEFRHLDTEQAMTPRNDLIGNAYGCVPENETLGTDIYAGEKASGKIVFDVPTEEGSVILPDLLWDSMATDGWEWAYPAK